MTQDLGRNRIIVLYFLHAVTPSLNEISPKSCTMYLFLDDPLCYNVPTYIKKLRVYDLTIWTNLNQSPMQNPQVDSVEIQFHIESGAYI